MSRNPGCQESFYRTFRALILNYVYMQTRNPLIIRKAKKAERNKVLEPYSRPQPSLTPSSYATARSYSASQPLFSTARPLASLSYYPHSPPLEPHDGDGLLVADAGEFAIKNVLDLRLGDVEPRNEDSPV